MRWPTDVEQITADEESTEESGATAEFVVHIGRQVRTLRQARGWTVQQLADAADLSRRMTTQIELGQANPSLATLARLARALGTEFARLALPAPDPDPTGPTTAPAVAWRGKNGSEAVLLGATDPADAELWRWTLTAGERYHAHPDRAGAQEIHHVLIGTLTLNTNRGGTTISAGQTAVIPSDRPYSYYNAGPETAVFYRVVSGA